MPTCTFVCYSHVTRTCLHFYARGMLFSFMNVKYSPEKYTRDDVQCPNPSSLWPVLYSFCFSSPLSHSLFFCGSLTLFQFFLTITSFDSYATKKLYIPLTTTATRLYRLRIILLFHINNLFSILSFAPQVSSILFFQNSLCYLFGTPPHNRPLAC